ncbi:hypothetical protein B9Z55_006848 [Caenorhabditis nigoni]|uniref:Uncharacterized protein n=1 Tax=Caenorhabditis nigoni TaxID=1611254 RepID=A0A2G5V785_9PELO|nr:hypothetical protein B9Z55_006848 [Caenorhabditis nigoni]
MIVISRIKLSFFEKKHEKNEIFELKIFEKTVRGSKFSKIHMKLQDTTADNKVYYNFISKEIKRTDELSN